MAMKRVLDGKLLKIFRGEKDLPNGSRGYFEEIRHPGASLVVPYLKNKIILIRQFRAVIDEYIWELPAGTLDTGETPRQCAKREVAEETGYGVKNMKKVGAIFTTPGFCNEKIHIFKAECSGRKEAVGDPDEIIRTKIFSVSEVRKMFASGKIKDAKTICGLSFCGII